MRNQDSLSTAFHMYLRKKTNWSDGVLECCFRNPLLHHSMSPCLLFFFACQRLFDDIANLIELFDPFGIQPKKFGPFNSARLVAYFFLGDILPQGVVEPSGFVIGVEPRRLSLPRQQPVDGNFGGVGMRRAVE